MKLHYELNEIKALFANCEVFYYFKLLFIILNTENGSYKGNVEPNSFYYFISIFCGEIREFF